MKINLNPIKGTFLDEPRKTRSDKGKRKRGHRVRTLKKILKLIMDLK